MIVELHLRDLGVIREAGVSFSTGLNVVTGETGVGKTLLVTSLALLTGARGHARLVRAGAKEAVIEAVIYPGAKGRERLRHLGLETEDELVLVRRISPDGRSRAWAGGQLVPVSTLAEIGAALVEMHGQQEAFALARPTAQLAAVDALAGNGEVLAGYREALRHLRRLEAEQARLESDAAAREREIEVLSHQLEEIDRAELDPDEEDELNAAVVRLEHADKLRAVASEVAALLGPEGASGALADAHGRLRPAAEIDGQASRLSERVAETAADASELARDMRTWAEGLEADPQGLERLRERKALLSALKRKHGGSLADVVRAGSVARARLRELEDGEQRREGLAAELAETGAKVSRGAADLRSKRRRAAKDLERAVAQELPALALPRARFEVECAPTPRTESGEDSVVMRFSASRQGPLEPLGKVASGGELSRAMIGVTLALAASHDVGVLVFDEADQGLGGEAALDLARRLQRLGGSHQVLVVSHLPQIAAFAGRHIAVRRDGEEVRVETLEADARTAEVSRMLAGLGDSELAQAHAAELLDLSGASADR